jgi:hypothetical protein
MWRFEQMATNVNVRIDKPSDSGMEQTAIGTGVAD